MSYEPRVVMVHPSSDLYGSDRVFVESVRALAESSRVLVVLPQAGRLDAELERTGHEARVVPFPVLRKSLLRPSGLLRLLAQVLLRLPVLVLLLRRERASLLYLSTMTQPIWLLAAVLARVPVVCHVHEAEDDLPLPLRLALYAPLLLSTRVLVNSRQSERTALRTVPALRRRTEVLYNGVDRPGPPVPARTPLDPPARLVLVGRLSPRKGTDLAVDAVALLRDRGRDVRLTVVGDVFPGYEPYAATLEAGIAARDLGDVVVFAGFRSEVWSFFDDADVVLVPSRQEPFGNVAVEAMLSERPVVVARVQGLTEIVEDGVNGVLVVPDDATALADAVEGLLAEPARARALAARGRQDAVERFSVAAYRSALTASLARLITHSPPTTTVSDEATAEPVPVAYPGPVRRLPGDRPAS